MGAKKWIVVFLMLVFVFILTLSLIMYAIDPFFQFRVRDNSYMLNARFACGGLIKNYDYDTLILGSSMTHNFDMDVFREELGVNPLRIGIGGINSAEERQLLNLAYKTGKADKYYICADMYMFTSDPGKRRIPEYLINDDFLSRCRYFLNYEAWFRYIPIDIGFMVLDAAEIDQSKKFHYQKSIDRLEDHSLDFTYGEDVVIQNYKSGEYNVSDIETADLYNKAVTRIDAYFEDLQPDKGKHIFFFPPYSMLYWADMTDEEVETSLECKEYFIKKALEKGLTVYDFQAADITADLDNYKDMTHYSFEINNWMTKMFATQEYTVTSQNYDEFKNKLIELRSGFKTKYAELLK